jgi:hypothetical protein
VSKKIIELSQENVNLRLVIDFDDRALDAKVTFTN